jgi:putative transposase
LGKYWRKSLLVFSFVARAHAEGVELTGADGLLTAMVRQVLQTRLEIELAEHLGYEPDDQVGGGSGNSRNGSSRKTVTSDVGDVELRVARDRNGTFDPQTVPKHQRRLDGLTGSVVSLYANGMTTAISGRTCWRSTAPRSVGTISKITDTIVEDMLAWQHRPLDRVYQVLSIDAIVIKVRDSQVANRPCVCRDRRQSGR